MKIEAAAAVGNGILSLDSAQVEKFVNEWATYLSDQHTIVKFVPASGAASRMFKNLFAFLSADYDEPTTDFEKYFFENIKKFAFKKALCAKCKENEGECVCDLIKHGKYKAVVANLLEAKGLNYGQLPKGLLLFHQYEDGPRTPMEEHLVEAALYACSDGKANIHFTVSHDHLELFKKKVLYKKLIAGVLVDTQKQVFDYLRELEVGVPSREKLAEMLRFVETTLCCKKAGAAELTDAELAEYLKIKFNRPIRVCGVVKNVGEPGGGPFLCYNSDGTVSPQILESSQIDTNNEEYVRMFKEGTHFNPVDLVCATKDYKGNRFNLPEYVDKKTGFISLKSKNGKELKALELPGLWNGAMSDWSTIFVEVPIGTFNPVKTVNDLLREQHQ